VVYACLTGRPPSPAATRGVMDDLQPLLGLGERLHQQHELTYSPAFLSAWQATLNILPAERPQNVAELRKALAGGWPAPPARATPAGKPAVDDDRTVVMSANATGRRQAADDATVVRHVTPATRSPAGTAPRTPAPQPPSASTAGTPSNGNVRLSRSAAGTLAVIGLLLAGTGGYWAMRPPPGKLSSASASAPAVTASMTTAPPATATAPPAPIASAVTVAPAALPSTTTITAGASASSPTIGTGPAILAPTRPAGLRPATTTSASPKPVMGSQEAIATPTPAVQRESGSAAVVARAPSAATALVPDVAASAKGPASASDICGKRVLLSLFLCMRRECTVPEFAGQADCRAFLKQQEQSNDRSGY
jgi:hypothetical protein